MNGIFARYREEPASNEGSSYQPPTPRTKLEVLGRAFEVPNEEKKPEPPPTKEPLKPAEEEGILEKEQQGFQEGAGWTFPAGIEQVDDEEATEGEGIEAEGASQDVTHEQQQALLGLSRIYEALVRAKPQWGLFGVRIANLTSSQYGRAREHFAEVIHDAFLEERISKEDFIHQFVVRVWFPRVAPFLIHPKEKEDVRTYLEGRAKALLERLVEPKDSFPTPDDIQTYLSTLERALPMFAEELGNRRLVHRARMIGDSSYVELLF